MVGEISGGNDVLAHMAFLIRWPQRVLALRLAISKAIRKGCIVFDAGCGPLGLLSIMSAKLGAARVIGVDTADLGMARVLAEENGVADRVEFIEGNLNNVRLPIQKYDVLLAMIYGNDVSGDLPQHHLMRALIERHSHVDTIFIPNRIRYFVTGHQLLRKRFDQRLYIGLRALMAGSARAILSKPSMWTRRAEWETHIYNCERQAGITFSAVRPFLDKRTLVQLSTKLGERLPRNYLGHLNRFGMTLLTQPQLFAEIDYRALNDKMYPEATRLQVVHPGRIDATVWQQDLVFNDILIRSTETIKIVKPTRQVKTSDKVVLSTDKVVLSTGSKGSFIPIDIE